jgi:hypothetical protein
MSAKDIGSFDMAYSIKVSTGTMENMHAREKCYDHQPVSKEEARSGIG